MSIERQINEFLGEAVEPSTAESEDWLSRLLALLRVQRLHYQTAHWQAEGSSFYGDHLLFERLYEAVEDEIDTLAEKMVAFFGPESVRLDDNWSEMTMFVESIGSQGNPVDVSLAFEELFLDEVETVYEEMSDANEMSLGLDDFLMAMSNDHEEHVYLLRQRDMDVG